MSDNIINIDEYEVWTDEGWKDFDGVRQELHKDCVKVFFSDGRTIKCSRNHVFIGEDFSEVASTDVGSKVLTVDGISEIIDFEAIESEPLYDLMNVRDINRYYTGGILSHNCHIVDEFWKAVFPTISRSQTSKVLIASTPNGKGNLFHKLYTGAERDENGFHSQKIEWNEIPNRDEQWKKEQIAALGSVRAFLQEFDNTFLDDGSSAMNEELFADLKSKCCVPKGYFMDDCYKVWKAAMPQDRLYVAGVDIAEGVGQDASVIQIFDITDLREIEQVATYHNNKISPYEFAEVLYEILEQWGLPPALVERNSAGVGVVERLYYDYKYPRLVAWGADKANANGNAGQMGVRANQNSKYKAIVNQRYWIADLRSVVFRDVETLEEFKNFERQKNGTWKAASGCHDDRVMSTLWALMILFNDITEQYYEINELDDHGKPKKITEIDYDLGDYMVSDTIYNDVDGTSDPTVQPVVFTQSSDVDSEWDMLQSSGWTPLEGSDTGGRNFEEYLPEEFDKYF